MPDVRHTQRTDIGGGEALDLVRALGLGVAIFAASLVINAVAGRLLRVDLARNRPSQMPVSMWLVGLVGTSALGALGASWYFASGASAGPGAGLSLEVVLVLLGIVLDAVFILPLRNWRLILLDYFRQWQFWLTLGALVSVCTAVGSLVA